jgi:hypothetical protein
VEHLSDSLSREIFSNPIAEILKDHFSRSTPRHVRGNIFLRIKGLYGSFCKGLADSSRLRFSSVCQSIEWALALNAPDPMVECADAF